MNPAEALTARERALIDATARRVVELLRDEPIHHGRRTRLVTASELAAILNVDRGWVYEHATELGAVRLGEGDRPRLRFDVDRALAARTQHSAEAKRQPEAAKPRRRAPRGSAELLPIHGRSTTSRAPAFWGCTLTGHPVRSVQKRALRG